MAKSCERCAPPCLELRIHWVRMITEFQNSTDYSRTVGERVWIHYTNTKHVHPHVATRLNYYYLTAVIKFASTCQTLTIAMNTYTHTQSAKNLT